MRKYLVRHFPAEWLEISLAVARESKRFVIRCESEKEAQRIRRRFYLFRMACERDDTDLNPLRGDPVRLSLLYEVVAFCEGKDVVFQHRALTREATLLKEGLCQTDQSS